MLFNMLSSFAVEIDSRQNFVFDISIISDLILSFDDFRHLLFEFLGSPLLRSLLITLLRLICNFQGPITSSFVEVLKFFASL